MSLVQGTDAVDPPASPSQDGAAVRSPESPVFVAERGNRRVPRLLFWGVVAAAVLWLGAVLAGVAGFDGVPGTLRLPGQHAAPHHARAAKPAATASPRRAAPVARAIRAPKPAPRKRAAVPPAGARTAPVGAPTA